MSFYEESSIIITPNAYKAGTLYAVVPTSGLADMDVTRATAATRVDESGLVNYAEVLGGEEVTNGTFLTNTSSLWIDWDNLTLPLNSSQQDGYGILDATTGTCDSRQDITVEIGKTYLIEATLKEDVGGAGRLYMSDGANYSYAFGSFSATTTETTFKQYVVPTQTVIRLYAYNSGSAKGYYKNVSLKEVTRDNVPRIDYTGGGCPHILAEPQRTNILTYSEDFSSWITSGVTLTPNYGISPDGTQNSTRLVYSAGSKVIYKYSLHSANTETNSIYVKGVSGETIKFGKGTTVNAGDIFTLSGDWQRIEYVSTTGNQISISTYSGATARDIQIWGVQIEVGSYPTSYIPTSGATVTRNQDVFTRDGIGSLINSEEGVLFGEIAALANDGTNRRITINDGTINNRLILQYRSISNQIVFYFVVGGSNQCALIHTLSNATQFNKIALKYKENDFALWVNGVEVSTDTSGNTLSEGTFNNLDFDGGTGNLPFYGKVKQLQVYPTALSDSELTSLTTL